MAKPLLRLKSKPIQVLRLNDLHNFVGPALPLMTRKAIKNAMRKGLIQRKTSFIVHSSKAQSAKK